MAARSKPAPSCLHVVSSHSWSAELTGCWNELHRVGRRAGEHSGEQPACRSGKVSRLPASPAKLTGIQSVRHRRRRQTNSRQQSASSFPGSLESNQLVCCVVICAARSLALKCTNKCYRASDDDDDDDDKRATQKGLCAMQCNFLCDCNMKRRLC